MGAPLLKDMTCMMWLPCVIHSYPRKPLKTASSFFRISDYLFFNDPITQQKVELWGRVQVVRDAEMEEGGLYDLLIQVYTNSNPSIISLLEKLNKLREKINEEALTAIKDGATYEHVQKIIGESKSHKKIALLIGKVVKFGFDNEEYVQKVLEVRLHNVYNSRNGMACYTYDKLDVNNIAPEYNIFQDNKIPVCIYHNVKTLFHIHEFHEQERDSILEPVYIDAVKNTFVDEVFKRKMMTISIERNLKCFQQYFIGQRNLHRAYHKKHKKLIESKDLLWFIPLAIFICSISLCLQYIYDPLWGTLHTLSYSLSIISIIVVFLLIRHWGRRYSEYSSWLLLQLEGEHKYVMSLKRSKYCSKSDNCRVLIHNINNLTNQTKSYLEAIIHKGNNTMAILSIGLAVGFFIVEVLIALIADIKTTTAIYELNAKIDILRNFL